MIGCHMNYILIILAIFVYYAVLTNLRTVSVRHASLPSMRLMPLTLQYL